MRAYLYQARSLIGSDDSGLSDPFARVVVGEYCKTTQVIEETLSPVWDELLVYEEILVYGRREDIKARPPTFIVETYDQDKVRPGASSESVTIWLGGKVGSRAKEIFCTSRVCLQVGRAEFLGRATARPQVYLEDEEV